MAGQARQSRLVGLGQRAMVGQSRAENEKGRAIDPALTPPKRSDLHPGKDHAFDIFDQIGKTNASNKRASKARLQRINICSCPWAATSRHLPGLPRVQPHT